MTDTATAPNTGHASLSDFVGRLDDLGLRIAQPGDTPLFTPEPQSSMTSMHWRWADLEPLFDELSEHIRLGTGSARRTLKLGNPGLAYGTTPTFWTSIQYILPGEVATAHRHTPEAFRFVMQGNGCRTTVNGENYEMNVGDLVLTPSWAWHDHVHHGTEPMIWIDVLDISLVRSFHSTFFQEYQEQVQQIDDVPELSYRQYGSGLLRPAGARPTEHRNPLLAYPKAAADTAIELASGLPSDPLDDVIVEYQDPISGRPAMTTMATKSQLLRPGFQGALHRHTGSKVYWVISGQGVTEVDGRRIEWSTGDFFSIPSWAAHRHANPHSADARLFRVDDSPVLRAFDLYRAETLPADWTPPPAPAAAH